ncbi:MAG: NAD(P)H-hydrate dehydratase [Sphingobacteriales bacterium]|nr:MAG: NAD(P)H-hydrate dehydratase [Sphingobacteriales bacterium]
MKIFSASQIRACDAYTIHASGTSSADLMERAANACVKWINEHLPQDSVFIVLCGTGNNGGDGLAITRLLHQQGYGAKAFLLQMNSELSADCQLNLDRLKAIDSSLLQTLQPDTYITDIAPHIVILDAILGTGLNRAPEGWVANFISHINDTPNKKIAIDIPSGMPADVIPEDGAQVLEVNDTLSFQFQKRSFLHPETGSLAGNIRILDIGLHETFIESTHSSYQITDTALIKEIYKPRKPFTHKGTYGTAYIAGGSYGMMGAVTLAAKAAYRAGAGKVTALIPECGYNILQTIVPEAMCMVKGEKHINRISDWKGMQSIAVGPGLGTKPETIRAFGDLLDVCKQPLLLDADALNILAEQPELLNKLPTHSILTPHPKEFNKLFGETGNSMQRLELARTQAMKYNIHIVLKDRFTAVISPEGECRYNMTGNAGMATGGSGDVLTGVIAGLLAQGYEPYEAATLGVYVHGLAGDYAAVESSQEAMLAGDIISHLGNAFTHIKTTATQELF